MGISIGFSRFDSDNCTPEDNIAPNPNPYKFNIKSAMTNDDHVILYVYYEGCTEYGGMKTLVYDGKQVTYEQLCRQNKLDPHFLNDGGIYPIARFTGDEQGLLNALKFTALKDNSNDWYNWAIINKKSDDRIIRDVCHKIIKGEIE